MLNARNRRTAVSLTRQSLRHPAHFRLILESQIQRYLKLLQRYQIPTVKSSLTPVRDVVSNQQ